MAHGCRAFFIAGIGTFIYHDEVSEAVDFFKSDLVLAYIYIVAFIVGVFHQVCQIPIFQWLKRNPSTPRIIKKAAPT